MYLLNKLGKSKTITNYSLCSLPPFAATRWNRQLSVVVPALVTRIVASHAQRLLASVIRQRVRLTVRFKRFTIPLRSAQCAESGLGGWGRTEMEVCVCFFYPPYFRTVRTPRAPKLVHGISPSLSDVCGRFRSSKVEA